MPKPLMCAPETVKRLPDGATRWRCALCGFTDTDRHGHFPHKIYRRCDVQKPPALSGLGQWLDTIHPGDGIAWLAEASHLKALFARWKIVESSCRRCAHRQSWLNARWRKFIWRYFSLAATGETADKSQRPSPRQRQSNAAEH